MDSVNLTIRIDRALKSQFEAMADDLRAPVSVLLRQFMAREVRNWSRRRQLDDAEHAAAVREREAAGAVLARRERVGAAFALAKEKASVPPIDSPLDPVQSFPAMTRADRRNLERFSRKQSKRTKS